MISDIRNRVFAIVARTFDVPVSELDMGTVAADVDGWDSLAHATLIIRLEKMFDVTLDPAKASEAQDLGCLVQLVEESQ